MGRPSDYTPEIAATICQLMAVDGLTLREIARREDMPDRATIYRWIEKHEEFRDQYARAREMLVDGWGDESLEIADDGSNDWMERRNEDGSAAPPVVDHEHIARSKLRIDQRRWMMSKLLPKKYGEKVDHTLAGPDGAPVVFKTIIEKKPGTG